jgi:hypothetical protein
LFKGPKRGNPQNSKGKGGGVGKNRAPNSPDIGLKIGLKIGHIFGILIIDPFGTLQLSMDLFSA